MEFLKNVDLQEQKTSQVQQWVWRKNKEICNWLWSIINTTAIGPAERTSNRRDIYSSEKEALSLLWRHCQYLDLTKPNGCGFLLRKQHAISLLESHTCKISCGNSPGSIPGQRCLLGKRYADEPWKSMESAGGGGCAAALPPGSGAFSHTRKKGCSQIIFNKWSVQSLLCEFTAWAERNKQSRRFLWTMMFFR